MTKHITEIAMNKFKTIFDIRQQLFYHTNNLIVVHESSH